MDEYLLKDLSKTEALSLVTKTRRRIAIQTMVAIGDEMTVDRLAKEVAARKHETSPEAIDEETSGEIHLALLHQDLPKLADKKAVRFDYMQGTVAPGEYIDDLALLL